LVGGYHRQFGEGREMSKGGEKAFKRNAVGKEGGGGRWV